MTAASGTQTAAPWGVFGHDAAIEHLRRALASDRLAHAYLFSGPDGVGKTTLARRLAQAVCCEATPAAGEQDTRPCLECRTCRQIERGDASDVERIGLGGLCDEAGHDHAGESARVIRICQVRRLERVASLAPFSAARRVFIIDGADRLQPEASHALLKTLEEPPATVLLLLTAVDPSALLDTVRSRCQELPLRPMPREAIEAALTASGLDAAAAQSLAAASGGRFGLAMRRHADPSARLLWQTARDDMRLLARGGRNARFDHAETVARRWGRERESVLEAVDAWREWWREVLLAAVGTDAPCSPEALDDASVCSPEEALRALRAMGRLREHLLANTTPQLALEVALLDVPVLAPVASLPRRASADAETDAADDGQRDAEEDG